MNAAYYSSKYGNPKSISKLEERLTNAKDTYN